jgi:hypothetical protein
MAKVKEFKYSSINIYGKKVKGETHSISLNRAIKKLKREGNFIIEIKEKDKEDEDNQFRRDKKFCSNCPKRILSDRLKWMGKILFTDIRGVVGEDKTCHCRMKDPIINKEDKDEKYNKTKKKK